MSNTVSETALINSNVLYIHCLLLGSKKTCSKSNIPIRLDVSKETSDIDLVSFVLTFGDFEGTSDLVLPSFNVDDLLASETKINKNKKERQILQSLKLTNQLC